MPGRCYLTLRVVRRVALASHSVTSPFSVWSCGPLHVRRSGRDTLFAARAASTVRDSLQTGGDKTTQDARKTRQLAIVLDSWRKQHDGAEPTAETVREMSRLLNDLSLLHSAGSNGAPPEDSDVRKWFSGGINGQRVASSTSTTAAEDQVPLPQPSGRTLPSPPNLTERGNHNTACSTQVDQLDVDLASQRWRPRTAPSRRTRNSTTIGPYWQVESSSPERHHSQLRIRLVDEGQLLSTPAKSQERPKYEAYRVAHSYRMAKPVEHGCRVLRIDDAQSFGSSTATTQTAGSETAAEWGVMVDTEPGLSWTLCDEDISLSPARIDALFGKTGSGQRSGTYATMGPYTCDSADPQDMVVPHNHGHAKLSISTSLSHAHNRRAVCSRPIMSQGTGQLFYAEFEVVKAGRIRVGVVPVMAVDDTDGNGTAPRTAHGHLWDASTGLYYTTKGANAHWAIEPKVKWKGSGDDRRLVQIERGDPEWTAYQPTYSKGDIIGLALDLEDGSLTAFKNGIYLGFVVPNPRVPSLGPGPFCWAVELYGKGTSVRIMDGCREMPTSQSFDRHEWRFWPACDNDGGDRPRRWRKPPLVYCDARLGAERGVTELPFSPTVTTGEPVGYIARSSPLEQLREKVEWSWIDGRIANPAVDIKFVKRVLGVDGNDETLQEFDARQCDAETALLSTLDPDFCPPHPHGLSGYSCSSLQIIVGGQVTPVYVCDEVSGTAGGTLAALIRNPTGPLLAGIKWSLGIVAVHAFVVTLAMTLNG